jgi:hypothetical protein
VTAFKLAAADALQAALQNATAMEARARAAVARLQELSQRGPDGAPTEPPTEAPTMAAAAPIAPREPTADEAETISRTLLLAQRSADAALAEAKQEAAAIVEAAKADSRRAGEAERVRVEGEVQALLARRDFLESDVDQLEQHISAQRERITEVVSALEAMTNRVPNGLAAMRRPQLSASDYASGQAADTARDAEAGGSDDVDIAELIDEVVDPDQSAELSRLDVDAALAEADTPEPGNSLFQPEDR